MERNAYDSLQIPIDKKYFDIIHRGMYDVCNTPGGTATMVQVEGAKVCGKTGTAQNPHGKDHSWFICFAPAEKPTIAICAMVENAGFGATRAAPIARDILDAYFHPDRAFKPKGSDSTKLDSTLAVTETTTSTTSSSRAAVVGTPGSASKTPATPQPKRPATQPALVPRRTR
jgi:penicillin-binding protein 2